MLLITIVLAVLLIGLIIKREKDTYVEVLEVTLDFYSKLFSKKSVEQFKDDSKHSLQTLWKATKQIARALKLLGLWLVALPLFAIVLPILATLFPAVGTFFRKD